MGEDYYKTLGISTHADAAEIKKAFHKLALIFHPDKSSAPNAVEKFQQISKAYETLNDSEKRARYDLCTKNSANSCGLNASYSRFTKYCSGNSNDSEKYKDYQISKTLLISLEEILTGVKKKAVKISRHNRPRQIYPREEKTIYIEIKKGCKVDTKITVPGAGPTAPHIIPGDVVIKIRIDTHPVFKRTGNGTHLLYNCHISLRQALCGVTLDIPLLMEKCTQVTLNCIITPGYCHVIPGQGLPLYENSEQRGNLIVKFHVQFPQSLSEHTKKTLDSCLQIS